VESPVIAPDPKPTDVDRALLVRARGGDQRAFAELLEHHRAGLHVLCRLMVGDAETARRVLDDIVLAAWRDRSSVESAAGPRAWLYRTALRACGEAQRSATCLGEEIDQT
jgi:RNA polymerase sigma-70 factor (ECF subfamily)